MSKKKAEGIDVYAPYRASAAQRRRDRVEAGLELPHRMKYPDAMASADRKRRAIVRGAEAESFSILAVAERDSWTCQLCNEPVDRALKYPDPKSRSLDHRVPISKGGPHTFENCQLAHLDCNVRRGASDLPSTLCRI